MRARVIVILVSLVYSVPAIAMLLTDKEIDRKSEVAYMSPTATATLDNGRIRLRTPFRMKDAVKALPGARWDPRERIWTVPATPAGAKAVCDLLSGTGSIPDEIMSLAAKAFIGESIKTACEHQLDPPPYTKIKPWPHQNQGYHLICQQPGTLLAHSMGTGKSKCVVDAVCNLADCQRTLILCPKSVIDTWPAEFAKHGGTPVKVLPLREGSISGRTKYARLQMDLAGARNKKIALVINYEAAWQGEFGKFALRTGWGMLVADEVHRVKSPSGRISRFMAKLSDKAKRRVGLTGTPLPHSPLDAYGIYRFLDPAIFGTSFVRFRARYAVMGGYGGHEVLGYQNQDEFQEKFYSIAHRVKKEDVLDLPEVVHEQRFIALSSEARRLYDELRAELIADVGTGVITAANALSRLLRLQQITSGFGKIETGQEIPVDHGKYDALCEILNDLNTGEPVVVFCRFRRDIEQVHKASEQCSRHCHELSGRFNELADWQQATAGDVLAVQIQAGGVGIDLTRAAYCVYYSLGFSLGDYEQSLARLHRPGQNRSVTYLHLIARNTVDEKVYAALRKRADVIEETLSQMKGK